MLRRARLPVVDHAACFTRACTAGCSSFTVVHATYVDTDFDAIVDGIDNCPTWWNPVRPGQKWADHTR